MTRKSLIILLLFVSPVFTYAQETNQLRETFIKEFNPQGHAYYQYGMSIADRGKGIAEQVAAQLDDYNTIINASDPAKVVQEFESKMTALNDMEGQLDQQQSNLIMNQLDELGDQVNTNDYQGIQSNIFGSMSALAEMGDAKAKLKKQKEQLKKERQQKYKQAFRAKYNATEPLILEFKKRAAFAENKTDEQYYLDYVEYLLASITNNSYSPPTKPADDNSIENKFVAEDVQWVDKAKYKFSKYIYDNALHSRKAFMIIEDGDIGSTAATKYIPEAYLDAAISFVSKAISINPTAKNYMLLTEFYTLKRDFTAYIMYLVAKELDSDYVENYTSQLNPALNTGTDWVVHALRHSNISEYKGENTINTMRTGLTEVFPEMHSNKLAHIQQNAMNQIKEAIRINNRKALNAFLDLNLDQSIKIDHKDILTYSIKVDQPDATQLILNKYIDGLSANEKNTKLQKTIMLSVAYDSPKVLSRFVKLKVSTNFTLKGHTPKTLAKELNSEKALAVLQGKNIDDKVATPKSPFSEQQRKEALNYLEKIKQKRREGKTEEELNQEALDYSKNLFLSKGILPDSQILSLNTGMSDVGKVRTKNGGTLLHLAINLMVENQMNFCKISFITVLNAIDLTVKDNDGNTAYDLLLKHEKELKKIAKKNHGEKNRTIKYIWNENYLKKLKI